MHKNIVLLDLGNLGSEQTMKKTHSHVAFNAFSPIFSHFYYTKIKSNQFIVTIIKVATPAFIVLLAVYFNVQKCTILLTPGLLKN